MTRHTRAMTNQKAYQHLWQEADGDRDEDKQFSKDATLE
jgi:hypothetical protein